MPSTRNKGKKKESKLNSAIKHQQFDLDLKPVPKVVFRINPDLYSVRVTRSLTKVLNHIKDFIIIETYRCMPLLGDEEKNAPDWPVHIVRYDIVFIDKQ